MPSVIIPAHNEHAFIADCLRAIVAEGIPDLEIFVVPNACTDDTADLARSVEGPITVLETETPGKTNAINLAEQHATRFPRLFLDGDIILQPGALCAVFDALGAGCEIASPRPIFETSKSDLRVTLFYRSLRANAYFNSGAPNGSGAFAVTEVGRSRWGAFPGIIADDGFVELHFTEGEARTAPGPGAIVWAPRTFEGLMKIKARARLGQHELRHKHPDLVARRAPSPGRTFRRMLADPRLWPSIPVYAYVRLAERKAAARIAKEQGYTGWLRDESARQPASADGGATS